MKKLLILFSLVIVATGVILTNYNSNAQDIAENADSIVINEDTVASSVVEIDEEKAVVVEETAKSNVLLSGKKKSGFSFITIIRGLFGMLVLIMIAWMFSANKKKVDWVVIGKGLAIQLILAICILYVPFVASIFEFVGKIFVKILDFTKIGSEFLFGPLMNQNSIGYIFAFQILPTIIFFSGLW